MKPITIITRVLTTLIVLAGLWYFRAPIGAWFGMKQTPAETPPTQQAADPHAGHTMPAGEAAADPHAGHAMPAAPAAEDHSAHGGAAPAAQAKGERKILYWQDPMHPAYRSDKPGIAPDCGMALVPVYADEAAAMAQMPAGTVRLTAEKQQLIGVQLGRATMQDVTRDIRAVAKIALDESSIVHAHSKVDGWIEELFVTYAGAPVQQGQPLFTLYSPELLSAQQEYLIALKAKRELSGSSRPEIARSGEALYAAAREKLRLWDVTDEQIKRLEETGQPQRTVTFYAEHGGVVMERKAYAHMRVEKDTDLFVIADLSRVWAIAEVYEYEAPLVSVGQAARLTLTALPGHAFTGKVGFIYPQLDPQTRTLRVRMDVDNPGLHLRPEMFANMEMKVSLGRQLVVPEQAVLDSGLKQYVFLNKGDGYFEPREVRVRLRTGGLAVIESGLRAGDPIVTSGNFLIDSESRLKAAAGAAGHQH